jgi:hypothetical protein
MVSSDRAKDAEQLVLRHENAALRRNAGQILVPRQPCRRTAWDRSPVIATAGRGGELSSPARYSK